MGDEGISGEESVTPGLRTPHFILRPEDTTASMTSELALHAYIFLGNALNHLLNGSPVDCEHDLHSTRQSLAELYAAVEPLTPANILPAIAQLTESQQELLRRCCQWCLDHLGSQFSSVIGLSLEEANDVLHALP